MRGFTIFDSEEQIPEEISGLLCGVRLRLSIQPNIHHRPILAILNHYLSTIKHDNVPIYNPSPRGSSKTSINFTTFS
jgi:hypothetical protein